jgi:hypothetical protein
MHCTNLCHINISNISSGAEASETLSSGSSDRDSGGSGALPDFVFRPFDEVPAECRARVFGVDYVQLCFPNGGRLYLTRFGWPHLTHLLPQHWYDHKRYLKQGQRLAGATSNVYRVISPDGAAPPLPIVIKFCRFAQDVPLSIRSTMAMGGDGDEILDSVRFNGPFEEFGVLCDLRRGCFGSTHLRVLTKQPLGIYSPPEHYSRWQLGRSSAHFARHRHALELDQQRSGFGRIELDESRLYITIFGWVDGHSAEELCEQGLLSKEELRALTLRVADELRQKGFSVLDNKPKHYILRRRKDGSLLRRHGQLVYLLVDFELLRRTEEYQKYLLRMKMTGE